MVSSHLKYVNLFCCFKNNPYLCLVIRYMTNLTKVYGNRINSALYSGYKPRVFKIIFFNETVFTQFKCWMCMTIRHSYRFQPLQIGLAYLSPKTRCVLCTFNTLIRLTIKYLYEILSLKNGLTKLFYFEHPTLQGEITNLHLPRAMPQAMSLLAFQAAHLIKAEI